MVFIVFVLCSLFYCSYLDLKTSSTIVSSHQIDFQNDKVCYYFMERDTVKQFIHRYFMSTDFCDIFSKKIGFNNKIISKLKMILLSRLLPSLSDVCSFLTYICSGKRPFSHKKVKSL